ncbi:MAG: hypothetical protein JNK21_00140 [Rhodospirillaceae bacterium]|nr:hypothetical protein [Rhodospirillaceae bacterium]
MLLSFAKWLAATPLSQTLQAALWVVPAVQSVHILAIAAVMTSVWVLTFRLLGLSGRGRLVSQVSGDVAPWIWWALGVLLLTGIILIIIEPSRELTNAAFLTKMSLIPVAAAPTYVLQAAVRRDAALWDRQGAVSLAIKIGAVAVLGVWIAIAVLGRFIAYVEYA